MSMNSKPQIAVVILNWNGLQHLINYLPSIVENTPDALLVLADNASTDGSLAWVAQHYPSVQCLENTTNEGFAKGYNTFLNMLRKLHPHLQGYVLLNSDVRVGVNWLQPLVYKLFSDNTMAAVQPYIMNDTQPDYFEYAGAAGGMLDTLAYPFCKGRLLKTVEQNNNQYTDATPIHWASGACIVVRADVYHQLGGLDADFFAHMEEIDYCWRCRNAGYTIYAVAASKVWHLGGGSMAYDSPFKTYLNFRNSLIMIIKNERNYRWLLVLTMRLLLDGVAGARFLMQGKVAHTWAIIRAHFYIYFNVVAIANKRKTAKLFKKIDAHNTNYSILYQYFIKRNKHFSALPIEPVATT